MFLIVVFVVVVLVLVMVLEIVDFKLCVYELDFEYELIMDVFVMGVLDGFKILVNIVIMLIVVFVFLFLVNVGFGVLLDVMGVLLLIECVFGWIFVLIMYMVGVLMNEVV